MALLCLHGSISAVCVCMRVLAAHIGVHVRFICVCYLRVSGPAGTFLVNKELTVKTETYGSCRQ